MPPSMIYEIIGYIASLLVAVSLMMSSILRLRIINLLGAVFFTTYGLLIHAYPVAAVNFFVMLIDLYYLLQMFSAKEYFRLMEDQPDSQYLHYFLSLNEQEIRRFQPGFSFNPGENSLVFVIFRNMVPAGLVMGEKREGGILLLALDYVIPGYRDFKIGHFLFQQHADDFRARGIREIYTMPGNPAHEAYLKRMGFRQSCELDGKQMYCIQI